MKNEKIRFYIWETKGAILLNALTALSVAFPPVSNFIFILAVTMAQDVKCLVKFKYMEKLCDSRGNL